MTLLITQRQTEERGNGTNRNFYFDFPVLNADELFVYILTDGNDEAVLREDYNITGLGNANGGSIYFNSGSPPSAAQVVHIQRWVENTQETNYVENDPFPADAHEDTLDRIVMMIQQTLQFYGVAQPGAFLMWDENGEYIVNGPDAMDIANAEEHGHQAYQAYLDALAAALAARNWAGGALNTNFTYAGLTSKSAYHYATLAMVYTIFPIDTVCWFGQMSAPIGWTIQTAFDDCLIGVRSTVGGSYYVATNPWTLRNPAGTARTFLNTTINGLGDVMLACAYGNRLYKSTDFGVNWAEIYPPGGTPANQYWYDVAMSTTGATMMACTAQSATVGRLYTSSDYGANWVERQPDGNAGKYWTCVDCSDDGVYMYAAILDNGYTTKGKMFRSSDSGANWTQIYPKGVGVMGEWIDLKCSKDGSKLIAADFGKRLWTSSDYGATWTERRPHGLNQDRYWYAVDMDSDGSHMIAVISNTGNGYVYVSTDYGITWAERRPVVAASQYQSACCNADGSYMSVAIYGGRVYNSTDSGATFVVDAGITIGRNFKGLDMNDVGDRRIICYYNGYVYTYAPIAASGAPGGTWDIGTHTHPQTVHSHTVGTISVSLPTHNHEWHIGPEGQTYDSAGNVVYVGSYKSGKTTTGLINEVTKANSRKANATFYTSYSSGTGGSATGSTSNSGAVNTGGTAMGSAWRPYAAIGIVAKLTTIPVA